MFASMPRQRLSNTAAREANHQKLMTEFYCLVTDHQCLPLLLTHSKRGSRIWLCPHRMDSMRQFCVIMLEKTHLRGLSEYLSEKSLARP